MIYLDNNATTRPSESVAAAVAKGLTELWQNPSSVHRAGQGARQAVELARRDVAALVGGAPREITFTSGGTEAIDLAIRGLLEASGRQAIVTTRVEHAAVRDLVADLDTRGGTQVRWAPVDREGLVRLDELRGLIDDSVALVSVQWSNNETGAIQPVREIGEICRSAGVPFHCDGTQWVGKMPTDVRSAPIDVLTFSPHKFHGPKGVGVLWAARGVGLRPRIHGTQELGRRGGTENVPGILGAGAAARDAIDWLRDAGTRDRCAALRDRFEHAVLEGVPGAVVNGPTEPSRRLWNTTNIGFPRLEAEALLLMLSERDVCASAGAACSSGSLDPSPVLLAMGVPAPVAHGSVRFSTGRDTTESEIDEGARIVIECATRLSASMPSG